MPTSITLRATKGSALTHNEVDANFTNLQTTADAALPTASLGTGVATALAVNVDSAGAFVTFNGELGTPSSGTLTNATGLPAAGVVGTAAILTGNSFTGANTTTLSIAAVSTDGLILTNTTAAAAGAQQWSPRLRLTGQGWKTNSTAASQTVDWIAENVPVQGAANPTSNLVTSYQINGGGYAQKTALASDGGLSIFGNSVASTPLVRCFYHANGTGEQLRLDPSPSIQMLAGSIRNGSALGGVQYWLLDTIGLRLASSMRILWCDTAADQTPQVGFSKQADGLVQVNSGVADTYRDLIARSLYVSSSPTNGQKLGLTELTELTTIAAAATTDTTIQMPAGAIVLAVSVRVTTVIPDATSFDVGDSGSATRFSTASVGVAANSTDAGTKAGAYYNASALSVRLTMNGTPPATNTGRVRVTIFYFLSTPPTS